MATSLIQTYTNDTRRNNQSVVPSNFISTEQRRSNLYRELLDVAIRNLRRRREESRRSQTGTI